MTIRERKKVLKALRLIMADDGDFAKGILILSRLVEIDYPAARILNRCTTVVDLFSLASGPNQTFKVLNK